MKYKFYNDSKRTVAIHPATFAHGCTGDNTPIKPFEERTFILPEGTYPWTKYWDDETNGLMILVSPMKD